jgi:hypothetical protein
MIWQHSAASLQQHKLVSTHIAHLELNIRKLIAGDTDQFISVV